MGVTASHREPERDRERASESLGEQVRAKKEPSLTFFGIPKYCFVAKQLNKTLFCHGALKLLKYAL